MGWLVDLCTPGRMRLLLQHLREPRGALTRLRGSPLAVGSGGTGAATLTAHGVLVGEGTGPVVGLTALAKGGLLAGQTGADPTALAVGTDGQVLTADSTAGAGLSYKTQPAGTLEQGTWTDVTASRALSTVYHNTSGKKRRVIVNAFGGVAGIAYIALRTDSANPPTNNIALQRVAANAAAGDVHRLACSGEVPNGWYYEALDLSGTSGTTLGSWFELDE